MSGVTLLRVTPGVTWTYKVLPCGTLYENNWNTLKAILEIRIKLKIETLYFIWFNVSRLLFIIIYLMFQLSRLLFVLFGSIFQDFSSLSHTKLFAFPFTLFTFAPLYTHAHTPLCHLISNTLKQKMMLFTFSISTTPT